MAVPAFPAFHVTGPVHHYVQVPDFTVAGNLTPVLYLGTAVVQPRMAVTYATKPFMNDIAGTSLPAQEKDDGQAASIGVLINRFSQGTVDRLRMMDVQTSRAGVAGRFSRGQIMYGVKTFRLWQVYENYLDPVTRALYPNLPIGYYWPQVKLAQLEDAPGNQDQQILCQFMASALFTGYPTLANTTDGPNVPAGARQWFLFSQNDNATDFPAEVRVPQ